MSKYIFPAVFKLNKQGGYCVSFPDIENIFTEGDDLKHAMEMAEDVLSLMLYGRERDGEEIPTPSKIGDIKAKPDDIVNLVTCDTRSHDGKEAQRVAFRFAGRGDCALIRSFILKLADYERMADKAVATEEVLEEWLFDKCSAEVIFALADGLEVGFALFFPNFSTFLGRAGLYLEDIFILPEYRRTGIGSALLRKLAGIAVERGYGRFEWACLDWNAPSVNFFLSHGATPMSDWTIYRLSGEALTRFVDGEQG